MYCVTHGSHLAPSGREVGAVKRNECNDWRNGRLESGEEWRRAGEMRLMSSGRSAVRSMLERN